MNRMKLYQHIKCVDTAIMPVYIVPVTCGLKVKIRWYNVTDPDRIWYMGLMETIFITKEQIPNWLPWEQRNGAKN